MQPQKSIKKNFVMNVILTMSSFIFPLITFPYVSRILGPEGTGKVSLVTSVIAYFAMFSQLGIPTYGIRACAKVRDHKEELSKVTQELFIINTVMGIITYCVLFVCILTIGKFQQEWLLYLIISTTILFNDIGMEWLYKSLEQYSYITIRSIIFKFVALLLMFLLVRNSEDYVMYGAISTFAASASNLLNFINVRKHISFKKIGDYDFRRHFRPIAIFFGMSCATTVYTNLDNVMLGFMKSDIDVGYYNAAVKVKSVLLAVVTSLATVLLPRASYYIENGMKKEFFNIANKALNFVMLVSAPMTIYFMFFAKESIYLLSGSSFDGAIVPMVVIMPTIIFIGLTNVMGIQMLVPLGKEKAVLVSEIVGAIVDFVLNIIFIPLLGAAGAALGTLAAEIMVFVVQFIYLNKAVIPGFKSVRYVAIMMGIIVACVVSLPIKQLGLGIFVTLLLSASLFFVGYLVVLNVMREPMIIEVEKQICMKFKGGKKK